MTQHWLIIAFLALSGLAFTHGFRPEAEVAKEDNRKALKDKLSLAITPIEPTPLSTMEPPANCPGGEICKSCERHSGVNSGLKMCGRCKSSGAMAVFHDACDICSVGYEHAKCDQDKKDCPCNGRPLVDDLSMTSPSTRGPKMGTIPPAVP